MFLSIDDRNSEWDNRNIEPYYLHFVFYACMINQRLIDCCFYYYVDWSNGSLIVRWLFKNQYFVQQVLELLSIVEVNQFFVTLKTVDRLLLSTWANFLRLAKKVGFWKGKKSTGIFLQNRKYVQNTKKRRALLIWNWNKNK